MGTVMASCHRPSHHPAWQAMAHARLRARPVPTRTQPKDTSPDVVLIAHLSQRASGVRL